MVIGRAKRAPHWGVQSRFRVIYVYMYMYIYMYCLFCCCCCLFLFVCLFVLFAVLFLSFNELHPLISQLSFISIDANNVYHTPCALNQHKAPGFDILSSHILKNCAMGLTPSLLDLFQSSISSCKFRSVWKVHKTCPSTKRRQSIC